MYAVQYEHPGGRIHQTNLFLNSVAYKYNLVLYVLAMHTYTG
jgi:hypothetical protein